MVSAESFSSQELPDYEGECRRLTWILTLSSLVWCFVMPHVLATQPPPKVIIKRRIRNGVMEEIVETKDPKKVPASFVPAVGCLFTIFTLILKLSPYNYYIPRRVFDAPLLTPEECQTVVNMAHGAAQRSYEKALATERILLDDESTSLDRDQNRSLEGLRREPLGWQKTRHSTYPTTDLNLVSDMFLPSDLEWIQNILDRRLGPTLERLFGIPVAAIRANDIFIVRYDEGHRTHLIPHTDDGDISFNILLTNDFEGGGTRFFRRINDEKLEPFAHVAPAQGNVLAHSALIHHEGVHITKGTRIILVGFLSVDRLNPLAEHYQHTGMSAYSSWMSLPWMSVKFKEGHKLSRSRSGRGEYPSSWKDSTYFRLLFEQMYLFLFRLGDSVAEHGVTELVNDEATARRYIKSLDVSSDGNMATTRRANWIKGQGLNIDIDGTVDSYWPESRRDNAEL